VKEKLAQNSLLEKDRFVGKKSRFSPEEEIDKPDASVEDAVATKERQFGVHRASPHTVHTD
jgi:hypothetical protein